MFISASASETQELGRAYAAELRAGEVVALVGDLGSGKTQFVKGVVAGLGSGAEVTSPTFTLIHEYSAGSLPVYHFDFYRLETADEALQLGLDEYIYGDGVTLIEWADRFRELMPATARWLHFETLDGGRRRIG